MALMRAVYVTALKVGKELNAIYQHTIVNQLIVLAEVNA